MSPGMRETVDILASLAGSFLLLLIFLGLLLACVMVWFLGRGLRLARGRTQEIASWIVDRLDRSQLVVDRSARRVVEPQIQALSVWTGLRAGWRTLRQGAAESLAGPADRMSDEGDASSV